MRLLPQFFVVLVLCTSFQSLGLFSAQMNGVQVFSFCFAIRVPLFLLLSFFGAFSVLFSSLGLVLFQPSVEFLGGVLVFVGVVVLVVVLILVLLVFGVGESGRLFCFQPLVKRQSKMVLLLTNVGWRRGRRGGGESVPLCIALLEQGCLVGGLLLSQLHSVDGVLIAGRECPGSVGGGGGLSGGVGVIGGLVGPVREIHGGLQRILVNGFCGPIRCFFPNVN